MINVNFKWTSVAILLSVVALVLCILMSLHTLQAGSLVGCGAGSSCDTVLASHWSSLFGIFPVSGIAVGVYMAVIVLLCFHANKELQQLVENILLFLSASIIVAALWFTILQVFVLHEFCKYCMTVHVTGVVIAVYIICKIGFKTLPAVFGTTAVLIMLLVQVFTPHKSVYQSGSNNREPLPFLTGEGMPVIGSMDAEYKLDLLFDYQCVHCRILHEQLNDIVDRLGGKVAIVLCPCPLNSRCNPYVPNEDKRFDGSCELSQLALAIYKTNPRAFYEFDNWLFEKSRSVGEASGKAAELVGNLSFDGIPEIISRILELFGRTSSREVAGIPRIVSKDKWVVLNSESVEETVKIIQNEFLGQQEQTTAESIDF